MIKYLHVNIPKARFEYGFDEWIDFVLNPLVRVETVTLVFFLSKREHLKAIFVEVETLLTAADIVQLDAMVELSNLVGLTTVRSWHIRKKWLFNLVKV